MTDAVPGRDDWIVGVDVGGANLKYATDSGDAYARPFAMWRHPEQLSQALQDDLKRFKGARSLAVTMTGELADCFVDRGVGVRHIIDDVSRAADESGIDDVRFYGVDGRFYQAGDATEQVDRIAAANWHALASLVGREFMSDGLLIDVGSTTTDIIPIKDGRVATDATTDYERLSEGSLVYIGCRRTPVCALVDSLRFRGRQTPIMNEVFATIDDARIVAGIEGEDHQDIHTADNEPRTCDRAANRLARMIGLDRRAVSVEEAAELSAQILDVAKERIDAAINQLTPQFGAVVISGHGLDLVDLSQFAEVTLLGDRLDPNIARCAPSYAVARLLQLQKLTV